MTTPTDAQTHLGEGEKMGIEDKGALGTTPCASENCDQSEGAK